MSKINPQKTIVVCLDIDETLINTPTDEFNGSVELWKSHLRRLKDYCRDHGLDFIVQIITAKPHIDYLVDKVAYRLREFLPDYSADGTSVMHARLDGIHEAIQPYYVMLYQDTIPQMAQRRRDRYGGEMVPVGDLSFLPAIHFCSGNQPEGAGSKALVMDYIRCYFQKKIPSTQLILLDNNVAMLWDAETGAQGATPAFEAVSAHELEQFVDYSKATREQICRDILRRLECKVVHVVDRQSARDVALEEERDDSTQSAATRLLERMHFDEYLDFFTEKAKRKCAKSVARPNNVHARQIAVLANQLHARLERAKRDFLSSPDDTSVSLNDLIETCTSAITDADQQLNSKATSCLGMSSFFATRKAYCTQRDHFMAELAKDRDRNNFPF